MHFDRKCLRPDRHGLLGSLVHDVLVTIGNYSRRLGRGDTASSQRDIWNSVKQIDARAETRGETASLQGRRSPRQDTTCPPECFEPLKGDCAGQMHAFDHHRTDDRSTASSAALASIGALPIATYSRPILGFVRTSLCVRVTCFIGTAPRYIPPNVTVNSFKTGSRPGRCDPSAPGSPCAPAQTPSES